MPNSFELCNRHYLKGIKQFGEQIYLQNKHTKSSHDTRKTGLFLLARKKSYYNCTLLSQWLPVHY